MVYNPLDKAYQKSVKWLYKNAFETPDWLIDKSILRNINYAGYTDRIRRLQSRHLNNLLNFERFGRLINHEALDAKNYYALELLRDIRS